MKRNAFLWLTISIFILLFGISRQLQADEKTEKTILDVKSPSVILMELESGQILYEKDPDTARRPASVTKLMTMLLAFEALDSGKMHLDDLVTISANAASMGGSQVYLEEGEQQSFQDLLKCMIVSSANDAATAVGEAIAGSQEGFVAQMNERAQQLGMINTHFENACGLEAKNHLMSARDIAILSRQLLLYHPEVTDYTTIWMDTIVHKTNRGESEFGLANTNKFLKKYQGATGLKTGYTSAAGFSMSATATRNGMTLIAIVMSSKTKEIRYQDAGKLLDYGFANCEIYEDKNVLEGNNQFLVVDGTKKSISVKAQSNFRFVFVGNRPKDSIVKKKIVIQKKAPIQKGDVVERIEYRQGEQQLGMVDIIAQESVEKQKYYNVLYHLIVRYLKRGKY